MGLDMWFKPDIMRILTALASAGEQNGPQYRQALSDVALAFGIDFPPPPPWYAVMPASCRRLVTLHDEEERG
jgi:hypothetical protein